MTELNVAMLDGLERDVQKAVKEYMAGDSSAALRLDRARTLFDVECLAQLRPLLYLVSLMGTALEDLKLNCHSHPRCEEALNAYRRAGGKLR